MSSEENPYAAPAAVPLPPLPAAFAAPAERPIPATHGRRFSNFLIDKAVIFGLTFGTGMAIGILAPERVASMSKLEDYAITYLLTVAYYTFMEGVTGTTLGKLITGTKIVDENGMRPSFGKMFQRSLCRIIPFEHFSFLASDARGWHDSITKTWVVRTR